MNKLKAVFFEFTEIVSGIDSKFVSFYITPEKLEILKKLSLNKYMIIFVFNADWIGMNPDRKPALDKSISKIQNFLSISGIKPVLFSYCPHNLEGRIPYNQHCNCHLPNNGLIKQLKSIYNLDLNNSWLISKSCQLINCGKESGLKTILAVEENLNSILQSTLFITSSEETNNWTKQIKKGSKNYDPKKEYDNETSLSIQFKHSLNMLWWMDIEKRPNEFTNSNSTRCPECGNMLAFTFYKKRYGLSEEEMNKEIVLCQKNT